MRKRIIRSFLSMMAIALVFSFGLLYMMVFNLYLNNEMMLLDNTLDIIQYTNDYSQLEDFLDETDTRLTVLYSNGDIIYDSMAETPANHLDREEIEMALNRYNGKGYAIRYSDTLQQNYLFVANYKAGTDLIYRIGTPFNGFEDSSATLLPYFLASFLLALLIGWFIANRAAKSIISPITEMGEAIEKSAKDGEPIRFQETTYKELEQITKPVEHMDEELRRRLKNEEKQQRMRQEFFSNASHELKTPLTSIRGYAELLSQGHLDESSRQLCLDSIVRESGRMTSLIEDIMMISQLEGEMRTFCSNESLNEVIDQALDALQPEIQKKELTIIRDTADITLYMNKKHIISLVFNLLDNAVKYNRKGGTVTIKSWLTGNWAHFEVSDTGIGIPEQDLKRLFQRFFRGDRNRTSTIPGTGLGLNIVKSTVEYYNGKIQVQSKEQEGSRFEVILPVTVLAMTEEELHENHLV